MSSSAWPGSCTRSRPPAADDRGPPARARSWAAGIAGLSAAWECHRQGVQPIVLEAQARAGGVIRTDYADDFVLDTGPDAFLATKPGGITLCRELGIDRELIGMKPPRGAAILRGDVLHALPEGGAFGIATSPGPFLRSTLLSPLGQGQGGGRATDPEASLPRRRERRRVLPPAFRRRSRGTHRPTTARRHPRRRSRTGCRPSPSCPSWSPSNGAAAACCWRSDDRRSGRPRAAPSGVSPGAWPRLSTRCWPRCHPAPCTLGTAAEGLRAEGNGWQVGTSSGGVMSADLLVLALPAYVVSALLRDVVPVASDLAGGIRYVSSAGVLAVYRDTQVARPMRGSGYVSTPEPGRDPLLATSWLSSKWEGRAPARLHRAAGVLRRRFRRGRPRAHRRRIGRAGAGKLGTALRGGGPAGAVAGGAMDAEQPPARGRTRGPRAANRGSAGNVCHPWPSAAAASAPWAFPTWSAMRAPRCAALDRWRPLARRLEFSA